MNSPFDPEHPEHRDTDDLGAIDARVPLPSDAELAESDLVLADLRDGHLADLAPSLQLLRVAAGPASADELEDRRGVGLLIASRAVLPPVAVPADTREPEPERPGSRLGLLSRIVATKAAIVTAVTVMGIAGAGAATGLIVAATSPPPTTDPPAVLRPAGEAPTGTTGDGTGIDDEAGPNPIIGGRRVRSAHGNTDAGRLGVRLASDRQGLTPEQYCAGVPVGTAGSSADAVGTVNGAMTIAPRDDDTDATPDGSPSDEPGSNGAEHGNSPDAGGNPSPGGNPNPGGNGSNNGNPNPGGGNSSNNGNPNPGGNRSNNGNPNPGSGNNNAGGNRSNDGNPNPGSGSGNAGGNSSGNGASNPGGSSAGNGANKGNQGNAVGNPNAGGQAGGGRNNGKDAPR